MVFHWSLSDSKSPQVSRTLLSIMDVLSNAIIWIVSTRLLTSKSSRPFNNPLVIVPKAPITIGKIVTFIFHSFFNSLTMSRYLAFFSHSFSLILWSAGTAKSTVLQILFFVLIILRSGLLGEIKWFVCLSFTPLEFFTSTLGWWSLTGDRVTESFLNSQGRFSVFWPFSIKLSFRWSSLGRQLPCPPVLFIILWWLYQKHLSRLV